MPRRGPDRGQRPLGYTSKDLPLVSRRIVITGAAGQLGQTLLRSLAAEGPTLGLTRGDLDVTNGREVLRTLVQLQPSTIANCSAFNAVDGAEDEPEQAFRVNALAVANLARAAAAVGATLVHYSSDFVFDGETDRPYREEDAPRPRGIYAASKLVGEWLARDVARHYVLRVESLFGGDYRLKSSVDRIIEAARGRDNRSGLRRPRRITELCARCGVSHGALAAQRCAGGCLSLREHRVVHVARVG